MTQKNPDLSLVMPCYNEADSLEKTVKDLVEAFIKEGIHLQLVLVDNGSSDHSIQIIDKLILKELPITKVVIEKNQGYGNGILRGFEHCVAPLVGFIHADGQLPGENVVRIYKSILGQEDQVFVKARRRFRKDGWKRRFVSYCYNRMMTLLFGDLGSEDINASPKIMSRQNFDTMKLASRDWFLDPEMMLKAKHLGLTIIEVDVQGQVRQGGKSNVRFSTCVEFLKNILLCKIAGPYKTRLTTVDIIYPLGKPHPSTKRRSDA